MWLTYIYFINIYITVPYIYDFMLIYKYILSTMLSTILMLISLHFCNKIYMWIYAQGDYNIVLPLIKEKWNDILEQMKIENDISEVAFTTWVKYFSRIGLKATWLLYPSRKKILFWIQTGFQRNIVCLWLLRLLKYLKPNLTSNLSFLICQQTIPMKNTPNRMLHH